MSKTKQLIEEASHFIKICYKELNKEQFIEERMKEIRVEIERRGRMNIHLKNLFTDREWHGAIVIDVSEDYFGVRCTY